MKKLLLIATLMLALVFTVVACNNDPVTEETTLGDTTVETPTEAPTAEPEDPTEPEETTEEPEVTTEEETTEEVTTADPADPVWIADPDAIAGVKGAGTTAYIADAVVMEEGGYKFVRITVNGGDSQFVVAKDLGTMPKYLAISYRANADKDGEMFIGTSNGPNGQNDHHVLGWNQDNSWNLMIVDVSTIVNVVDGNVGYFRLDPFRDVTDGYIDIEYIAFFNTAEYAAAYAFEMHKAPMWDADKAVISHQSFDELDKYANDTKIEGVFTPGQSGGWDKVLTLNDFSVEALRYWGWIAGVTEQGVFGYQINGGAAIYDEAWTHPEDLLAHAPAGSTYTTRMKIMISLEGLDGENTIRALYKDAAGTEVCLNEFTVILPEKPKDITNTFTADVNANEIGTGLDASDLSGYFTVELPLGSDGVVANGEGKMYAMTAISDMYADVNGKYFIKTNNLTSSNGFAFVRGYKVVNSDEIIEKFDPAANFYKINNYYEMDGAGQMGGAGLYARVEAGTLHIMIKYYNAETVTRVGNKIYTLPVEGTELIMADDGEVVSILVGGKTYATIALSGSTTYADINEVQPKNGFAASAVVTLVDGTTETIENTLIAESCECQVGVVVRGGHFKFDTIEVGAYSAIEIPEFEANEPETPDEPTVEYYENLAVPQSDWVISGHMPIILSPENKDAYPNHYPMVAAGGIESGALLYQGSIYLGNLDLSKYSKVVVMWGHDNSAGTLDKYNNNANNRFALVNTSKDTGTMSPAEDTIIASTTCELKGWGLTALEIDLSEIDYSGDVYLTNDSLEGCFALVYSVEFIGAEIPAAPVEPEA